LRGINFEDEIKSLILSKREGDYWDFKQQYHTNKAELLHDIICMANNRVDRDAYIIFGVADTTYEVVGVENDEKRRNQQKIIDFLRTPKFVSGIRPQVEMRTLQLEGHEVDVLIIKNSTDTPYFLTDDYTDNGRTVRAYYIYTRVGDTNTAINKSADINYIEYLWKKRFLLTRSPFEQIMKRLEDKGEWKQDEDTYYNIYNPEFTITLEDDEMITEHRPKFYAYAMMNESVMYEMLSVKYFGTKLYSRQVVILDGGRYCTPVPDWGFLYFGENRVNATHVFNYFTMDSPAYKLNEFLYNEEREEARIARENFFEVVLLFKDEREKSAFLGYVYQHKDDFLQRLEALMETDSWGLSDDKRYIVERLNTGKLLKQMLKEFREMV
jgi:Divergent AAA domain.